MHANKLLPLILCTSCAAAMERKAFDQMTAEQHLAAAARENELADEDESKITGLGIVPGNVYGYEYAEAIGDVPWGNFPELYTAWPRVTDPSEKYEDRASKHRENALRHESAAALLEGRPSPRPLPPWNPEPLIPPDRG